MLCMIVTPFLPAVNGIFWFQKGCKPNFVFPERIRRRESFVSAASTRNPFRVRGNWSGPLRGPLFGLAPDGVFRASALTLGAVGSYSTFSPLPSLQFQIEISGSAVCFLWHYPSGRLTASPPACILQSAFFRQQLQVTRHRALWCSDF